MPIGQTARVLSAAVIASRILLAQAPSSLVIRGAAVFDSISGAMLPGRTVVIKGERIQSVGSLEHPVRTPRHARVIDGRGKFLIPGLIDAHVHSTYVLELGRLARIDQ